VIRAGRVLDGFGRHDRVADVGIEEGRVVAVGRGLGRAQDEIDARGKVVAPGFIDIHTHSDFTLPVDPSAEAKLRQGVTTDVTGNCGFSPFPLRDDDEGRGYGRFFSPGVEGRWDSLADYRRVLEDAKPAINVAPLVGLGSVRLNVMGSDCRHAGAKELSSMRSLVEQALAEGAFGASSGLVYAPGSYADTDEISEVVRPLAEFGGFYATHVRDESDGLVAAINEALDVGRRTGCPVQLSHHKAIGRRNWGLTEETLSLIEDERGRGVDVALDVYPYTAGSTTLVTLVPASDLAGGEEALLRRLADPAERARIARAIETDAQFSLDDVMLASVPSRPELNGRRLVEAAASDGCSSPECVLRLIELDGSRVVMLGFGMAEEDVRRVLRHSTSIVGSDGWVMRRDGVPYVHPRNFACTARLFSRYVRDEPVLSLGGAIARLTSRPALRLGLKDRGVLQPGAAADIVVFDLERVQERATFAEPCRYPEGFDHVLVGGRVAVRDGEVTGARAGRVLVARKRRLARRRGEAACRRARTGLTGEHEPD
jgi:N-acyl-D-amino-acid deacylase